MDFNLRECLLGETFICVLSHNKYKFIGKIAMTDLGGSIVNSYGFLLLNAFSVLLILLCISVIAKQARTQPLDFIAIDDQYTNEVT